MIAALAVPLAAAVCTGSLDVAARAEVRAETRAGWVEDSAAPAGTSPEPRATLDQEVTPSLKVTGHDEDHLALEGSYSAAFLSTTREPSLSPLVLHTLGLNLEKAYERGDALRLHIAAISGPLDYDRAARELGGDGTIAAFPRGGLVSYANADAFGALYHVLSRRWATETDLMVGYTGPSVTEAAAERLFKQFRGGLIQRLDWLATRRTTLSADVMLTGVSFEGGADYAGITPGLGFRYRLSRQETLAMRGGVQLTRTYLPADGGGTTVVDSVQPAGSASLTSLRPLSRRTMLTLQARGELAPFYDPFRGVLIQRAVGSLSAEVEETRGRSASLRLQWYEPLPGSSPVITFDVREERLAAAALTLGTPIVSGLRVELGAVALKHWDPGSSLTGFGGAPELLGFLTLVGRMDFGRYEAPLPRPPPRRRAP